MAKSTNVIRVLKTPKEAFNKHRPVSDLIWTQIEHLTATVKAHIDPERRAVNTESEASKFIAKYTAFLHSHHQQAKKTQHAERKKITRAAAIEKDAVAAGKKSSRSSKRAS